MMLEPRKMLEKIWVGAALLGVLLSGAGCENKKATTASGGDTGALASAKVQKPAPDSAAPFLNQRGPNERFYTVQEHLDVGGTFYLYASVKDILKKKVEVFEPVVKQAGMPPEALKAYNAVNQVIDHLGVYGIHDIGISTVRDGDFNRSKLFINLPEGRGKGIPAIWGGEAHALKILDRVPQDTQMLVTGDVDPSAAWNLLRAVVQDIGGNKSLEEMDVNLTLWKMRTGINLPEIVPTLGGEFAFVLDQSTSQKMVIPMSSGVPLTLDAPRFTLMIKLQKTDLYDSVKTSLSRTGKTRPETTEGNLRLSLLVTPFVPFWPISPALATDGEYMYISTHADHIKALAGTPAKTLRQSSEFQKLYAGLPAEANGCIFVSERLKKTYMETVKTVVTAQTAQADRETSQLIQKLFEQQGPVSGSLALRVNQTAGVLILLRSQSDMAELIPSAGIGAVGLLAGIAIPGFISARNQALELQEDLMQAQSDQTAQTAGMQCATNLQKIDAAKEMWALENNKKAGDLPTWNDLAGPEKYLRAIPACPDGGVYLLNAIGQDPICNKGNPANPTAGHLLP